MYVCRSAGPTSRPQVQEDVMRARERRRGWWLGVLLVGCSVASGHGQPAAGRDEELARLEALLQAQQQRIEQLQERVAATGQAADEAARTAALRQQIRAILSEPEFRESLMPAALQAGYDNGFFLRSTDEKFLFRFHGRMQFRWTHYATRSDNRYLSPRLERDDRTGFDLRRIRLTLDGHVYDPKLTYLLELMADSPTAYSVQVLYAWVNYRFVDEFQIKTGIMQLAGTRAAVQSSANMQFPEYPTIEAIFGIGTGLGVRFWGQMLGQRLDYNIDIANSLNGPNNRTITPDETRELDGNPALAFRTVWHACGPAPTKDFADWGDISYHEEPCVDLGFHYAFNEDDGDAATTRLPFHRRSRLDGGFGLTTTNGLQINQFGWDAAFKYRGFSISGEYIVRIVDPKQTTSPPFAPLWQLTGQERTTAYQGGYVQAGYFLPIPGLERKLEAVARVGGLAANNVGAEGMWTYGGGVNYYIEGNRVKLQADVEKITEVPISANSWLANVNDDALIFRVQLQVAF
jgi:hypothetical protein